MGIMNKVSRFVGPAILPKVSYQRGIIDTYTHFYLSENVSQNTILYESRDGKSLTDSPFAIFEFLLETDKNAIYTHVWVVTASEELLKVQESYRHYTNVLFVVRNSEDYLKWLAKAEYLINNSTFQPFVTIKEEQTYINTWHGTPLKTMGFDIPGNPANAKNVVRNFFMADYLISPNPHTTKMFTDSYRLNQNYSGKIIENGYPRIDQTFKATKDEILGTLQDFGVELDQGKKTLLYTPTCKEGSLAMTTEQVAQIHQEMSLIRNKFGYEYNVLIKVHPFLYNQAKTYEKIRPYLIPDVMDTNQVLAHVDCLITDYSSIFFDFLVTDKPILFYCWDDDLYGNERGKYLEYEVLPGPVSFNVEELMIAIENLAAYQRLYQDKYRTFKRDYTPYDDGKVTERLVDLVFNLKDNPQVKVIEASREKENLLFYPGGMHSNGITSSFLNLMDNLDGEKYNVVCFLDDIKTVDQIKNVSQIPKNISLLFRFEAPNYTIKEHYQDLKVHLKGVKKGKEDKYPAAIYQREVRRLLGKKSYDVAIDFSGYSLHWSKMVLGTTSSKYICFLHSDMKRDQQRVVNGRKIHQMNLQGIFSVYNRYDKLVSVSEVINQVNQEELADYAPADEFVYATNTINPDKILGKIKETEIKEIVETKKLFRDGLIKNSEQKQMILTNRPDTSLGSMQEKVFDSEKVIVLGEFNHQGVTYYKIVQNNIYLGWVMESSLEVLPVKVINQKETSYFGEINTIDSDMIYSGPIGLEDSIPLSNAKGLKNLYAEFNEEIITQENGSFKLVVSGKELGYIRSNKVSFSRRLNWTKNNQPPLQKRWLRKIILRMDSFNRKEVIKELDNRIIKKEIIDTYYYNKSLQELAGYKSPNTLLESIDLGKPEYLYVVSLVETFKNSFYEVRDESGDSYWIKKETLMIAPVVAEEFVLEKEIKRLVEPLHEEIEMYATPADCLKNHGTMVRIKSPLHGKKIVKTSEQREFILVSYVAKELWVAKEEVSLQKNEGVFNAEGMFFGFPSKEELSIVTTGRLSEEKNQVTLIEAFAKFKINHPESKLYIIGSGPEEENLKNKVKALELTQSVILMGQVYNPFVFMKECQIFALTSLYEGQSIVLLEALTLGMTCLSTDIPACRNVLEDGKYGLLTKNNNSEGIYLGLEKLVEKNNQFEKFDANSYNKEALTLFYRTLM